MSDVAFSDLYGEIRTLCADHGVIKSGSTVDSDSYIFRNDILDNAIKVILYELSAYSKASGSNSVTPEFVSDNDRLILIYSVAVALLSGLNDEMLTSGDVRIRNAAPRRQLEYCVLRLCEFIAKSEAPPFAYDTSVQSIFNTAIRWSNQITGIYEG